MEQQEGKLRSLTLQEKLELITIVEDGRSVKDVAEEYAVNRNTLHYILKHKDTIRKNLDARPGISNCKRIKKTKCPELEKRILDYMYESRERQEKLSGSSIKAMALELASELEVENFSASNGWLFSLFKRHQITISQFNKGIKSMGDSQNLSTCNSVNDSKLLEETIVTTPDTFVEAETTFHEAETTKPEYENFDFNTNTSCNDFFETEVVNEDDQEERLIEEDVQESDPVWRSWCRMCGEYDAAQRIDEEKIEIVQQLLNISEDCSICVQCSIGLEDIFRTVYKAKVVESMLLEIQARETHEILTSDLLIEIRRDFGLDQSELEASNVEENTEHEDAIEESEDYEEIIYENPDSYEGVDTIKDEAEMGNEEEILYEESMSFTEEVESLDKEESEKVDFVYACHLCDAPPFPFMHSLTIHTRQFHQSLPKVVCSCGRYLSTWEGLMNHKRKHTSEQKLFQCTVCEASFVTKTGLSIHFKFKHEKPTKNHICLTCNREFKDATVLKTHMRTHLPDDEKFAYECEICGKKMANKWSVKYHISTIHERQKTHFCQICNRGFGNKSNLRSHLISHSIENVSCDICGNRFKNRISLQSHKKIHKPENSRKFSCSKCNKTFFNRNHLARHMVAHSDERKHKCPFESCMSEYKWQKDLTNHIASAHTGEKNHKCPWCDRTFVDSTNARKHKLREHPDELREFEAQNGKKRKADNVFQEQIVIIESEVNESIEQDE